MHVITKNGHRYYQVNGKEYLSVTTPLKILSAPALDIWKLRIGEEVAMRVSAKASKFGTHVHDLCDLISQGLEVTPEEPYVQSVDNFRRWFETVDKVVASEQVVFSDTLELAGKFDLLVQMKGEPGLTMVDIKTGKVRASAALQLAAYKALLKECQGLEVDRRIILSIRHDRKKAKEVECVNKSHAKGCVCMRETHEKDWLLYQNVVSLFKWGVEYGV